MASAVNAGCFASRVLVECRVLRELVVLVDVLVASIVGVLSGN